MAFYVSPPDGILSLDEMRLAALTRFKFLAEIFRIGGDAKRTCSEVIPEFAAHAQYLIEGSTTDQYAYFLLRLLAHVDPLLLEFVTHCERLLLKVRMKSPNPIHFATAFRKLRRHLYLASVTANENEQLGWQQISEAVSALQNSSGSSQHIKDRSERYFWVPFTFVLPLIRTKQVRLSGGLAEISPEHLSVVHVGIFDRILSTTAKSWRVAFCRAMEKDERIVRIANELKTIAHGHGIDVYSSPTVRQRSMINSDKVDQFSFLFPACMRHLHRELRTKHRLKHHHRIEYTLYLREIGLPLSEAVKFWSSEYKQKTSCSEKKTMVCQRSWTQDQRKYEYSLRHMYGFEGARKNYSAHCCKSLQSRSDSCVFRSFDRAHMRTLLVGDFGLTANEFETCWELTTNAFPSKACSYVKSAVTQRLASSLSSTQVATPSTSTASAFAGCQSQPVLSSSDLLKVSSPESPVDIESCFDHPICRTTRTSDWHRKPSEYFSEMLHIRDHCVL